MISLPSQFLLPNLDDSSSDEETRITELNTEVEHTEHDNEKEMLSINSKADSLVDTKELLEFIDTMDVGDTSNIDESVSQEESDHIVTTQDEVDPKSESPFSSFMSYQEGESSSLDPSTNGKELSKSPIEDTSLPSQFLLPNLDDSSSDEETRITELNTEVEHTEHDNEKEMLSINSKADSLVDTKELLEFIDTMDVGDTSNIDESVSQEESDHIVTTQDEVDPKSESQFSSFMSYHEGESSSLDPSTNGKELSKSPIEDSIKRHDSGVGNQGDINSHDNDMIAYESNETSAQSIDISFPNDVDSQSNEISEDNTVNPTLDV